MQPAENEYWFDETETERFALSSTLTPEVLTQVLELRGKQSEVAILQHPEWDRLVRMNGEVRYFTSHRQGELTAFAIIRFPVSRIAKIEFGPVAVSVDAGHKALRAIIDGLKNASGAWYLNLQLPWQTSEATDRLEASLIEEFGARTYDDKRNWASSFIDTSLSDDQIRKSFSKNHKRSIKKAEKLGLTARIIDSAEEVTAFSDIYVRMYETRGENKDQQQNLEEYLRLLDFFRRTGEGFFFGVFQDSTLIGGMIITAQGDYGFYYHSASDPEHRKIPVQHIGVVSILDALREKGIRYFDFGGYNHMVDENDQVYNINRFKDGFTKEYLYYPKQMYFEFVPNAVRLLETFQKGKDLVKKVIGR